MSEIAEPMATERTGRARLTPGHLGWAHVLLGIAVAIACAMVLPALLMMGAAGGDGADPLADPFADPLADPLADPVILQPPAWMTPLQFTVLALLVVWILRRARRKAGARGDAARWISPSLRALAVVGVAAAVFAVAANLLLDTPGIESPKAIVNQLGLGRATWSDALIIAGVAVAAPVGEELALRGLVFRGAFDALGRARAKRSGKGGTVVPFVIAAVLSAAVFAVLHLNPAVGQNVFFVCLGLGAATAFWMTGALTSAVWVHSLVNAIGLAFAMFVVTDVGAVWHAVALAAAPLLALALMKPIGRVAGGVTGA